ncbi:cation/H(+) antiporter 3-like [Cornus florida]|uniref:cation/H(+) antiporter 3-like n=1 Tax=Cornus florida TaxID=4283 RepID=UPI002897EEE8|nr:cation/H(+) antiporter 3-like [Cornus florida]
MVFSSKLNYISFTVAPTIKYIILTQTFSPFPVIACLLNDLKIINSDLGRLALATALIRDYSTPEGKPVDELCIAFISCGVLLSAIISDFLGAQMYHWKVPLKDATTLALILSTQGIVEMAGLLIFTQNQSPDNAELRIFVCVHRQDEALAAIKLLEVTNPSRESPLLVHVLHLMELKGQATPLLINHKFGQKISATSRSRQIIDIFNYYKIQYLGLVNVQAFTAISTPKFMHYNICSLAFDKLTSLVILPFHRKWNSQGKMIVNNNTLRSINHQVIELAPCSVGILVDRRKIQRTTPVSPLYHVAVLFLGGNDDREALAYANRMAQSPAVHLTVLRLVAEENTGEDNGETMLDSENLKEIRLQSSPRGNVMYREEKVKDGLDTALIIHTMDKIYDLIMVGQQHRLDSPVLSGLLEWTELPELGAIGDLLASQDTSQPVSILVVQQQHTKFKTK